MRKTVSDKQLKANAKNAKKGGVKTPGGKEISKYNAMKHGILSDTITAYDKGNSEALHKRLIKELRPETAIEEVLVERIALYIIRLNRAVRAETEYIMRILNPDVGHWEILDPSYEITYEEWIIDKEGYRPKINIEAVKPLANLYLRYEKSLENRLYRMIQELERIQRGRCGEKVPPPVSSEIKMESS